jgi:isopenicillin-N N-acyltransferase-like protein
MLVRRSLRAIALVTLALCAATARADEPRVFTPVETAGARLFYQGDIPIAVFGGSPEDIGRQHAALLGEPATHILAFPKQLVTDAGVGYVWPLMVGAGQLLIRNVPEPHRRELAALSNAGKLDVGDLAVANTLLELRRMGCSVLMVEPAHSATGGPLFGRNFDFPPLGVLDKYSIVLIDKPTGRHAFASVCFPGGVGVISGMNDAGLAIATLDVEEAADGSSRFDAAGTPLAFVFRRILEECTTVAEAEKLLRGERRTTWMNLAVCDKEGSAVFEITPKTIGRRGAEGGVLPCTNNFRTAGLKVDNEGVEPCWRYPRLAQAADAPPLSVDDVRHYLDLANQGELTLQTMVFEPRALALHLAIGKPPTSHSALTRIDLAPLFKN